MINNKYYKRLCVVTIIGIRGTYKLYARARSLDKLSGTYRVVW